MSFETMDKHPVWSAVSAIKVLDELPTEEEYHKTRVAAHYEIMRLREVIEEQDMEILSLQKERDSAYRKLEAIEVAIKRK